MCSQFVLILITQNFIVLWDLVFFLTRFIEGSKFLAGSFTLAGDGTFLFLFVVVFNFSVFLLVGALSLVTLKTESEIFGKAERPAGERTIEIFKLDYFSIDGGSSGFKHPIT